MTERLPNAAERLARITFRSSNWKEVTATVRSSAYHPARLRDAATEYDRDKSFFVISFSYTVDGEIFVDEYERSEPLDKGHQIAILYNPSKPGQNNLSGTDTSVGFRIAIWIGGVIFAALLIYLTEHFDLRDH